MRKVHFQSVITNLTVVLFFLVAASQVSPSTFFVLRLISIHICIRIQFAKNSRYYIQTTLSQCYTPSIITLVLYIVKPTGSKSHHKYEKSQRLNPNSRMGNVKNKCETNGGLKKKKGGKKIHQPFPHNFISSSKQDLVERGKSF